jgi:hypothetical protein
MLFLILSLAATHWQVHAIRVKKYWLCMWIVAIGGLYCAQYMHFPVIIYTKHNNVKVMHNLYGFINYVAVFHNITT